MAVGSAGKKDAHDLRAGRFVARIEKASWSKSGKTVLVQKWGRLAHLFLFQEDELPVEVQVSMDPVAFWEVEANNGVVTFLSEKEREDWKPMANETFTFDEDGEPQWDLLVERLIDKCELDLRNPDHYRFNGLNDEQWAEVKRRAHETVNGREP